jgi:molybdenum cofactor cytidylyltransferase
LTIILLSAGRGTRFDVEQAGRSKILAKLPDGRCVLEASLANLCSSMDRVVIVARQHDAELAVVKALAEKYNATFLINQNAADGMGTSIACGVDASRDASGWLIALGDMPYVEHASIKQIAATLAKTNAVVCPMFRGQRGHPVGFPAVCRQALLDLHGDQGARAVVANFPNTLFLELDDAGLVRDIDTPADLG